MRKGRSTICQRVTKIKRRRTLKEEVRNWLDLPQDVMIMIFMKLGVVEILVNAQKGLVHYIVDQSNRLKSLRLGFEAGITGNGYIEVFKRLQHLEDLELCLCVFNSQVIEELGRSCQSLKYFHLNLNRGTRHWNGSWDEEAFVIAKYLPQLRRLCLVESALSNKGLEAILDGCPHIEYLDLQDCVYMDLKGDLLKRCVWRKRKLKHPDGTTKSCITIFRGNQKLVGKVLLPLSFSENGLE
ncbi:hypothetical protein IFM89_007520 [Coptis chinensis]|uniref:Uncharacterized protein n=1 Tax=Coptis chinensis TaxID=261450 RepID=A0A835I096_9MAGN|nr:hypothetical protein IFM89_007520 [Coptis chinensis]